MVSHLNNPWNNAVTFLEMLYGKQLLAFGSGFFWERQARTYLVTNWHNLSGRDPVTRQPIADHGGVPDRALFTAFRRTSEPDTSGFFGIETVKIRLRLYEDDLRGPHWFQHPKFGPTVDVATIDVTNSLASAGVSISHANNLEGDVDVEPTASQDIFILGFPVGLVVGIPIPVWKRGSIATDPSYDPDGLPKIFVDSATRKGMSGSVVLARHVLTGPYQKKDGTMSNTLIARKDQVLGVYCGRLHADNVLAQIGMVWKRYLIDEVIDSRAPATPT